MNTLSRGYLTAPFISGGEIGRRVEINSLCPLKVISKT